MNWNELLAWMRNQENVIRVNLEQGLVEEAAELARDGLHKLAVSRPTAMRMGHGEEWDAIGEKLKIQYQRARDILSGGAQLDAAHAAPAGAAPPSGDGLSAQELRVKGEGLYHVGLYADARESFLAAYQAGLREFDLVQQILETWAAEENYPAQVEFLDRLLKEGGQSLEAKTRAKLLFRLGNILAHLKDAARARQAYWEVRRLDPDFPLVDSKLEALEGFKTSFTDRYAYLTASGRLKEEDLAGLRGRAEAEGEDLDQLILSATDVTREELGRSLAAFYNVPFVTYDPAAPPPAELLAACRKEPEYFRRAGWIPLARRDDAIEVVMSDPFDLNRLDEIRFIYGTGRIAPRVALAADVAAYIDHCFAGEELGLAGTPAQPSVEPAQAPAASAAPAPAAPDRTPTQEAVSMSAESSDPQALARDILSDAVRLGAHDVHLEPRPRLKACSVRYRIAGACREFRKFPIAEAREVVARFKSMAGLDPAERRLPQDGRIRMRVQGSAEYMDFRVTTYPVLDNYEDVVLTRLEMGKPVPLDRLGMLDDTAKRFEAMLAGGGGLLLVVGPTGSGKTVTLHSALAALNAPDKKILTAEDPVEMHQEGIRQVQLNPIVGLTFASALRTFMRSDPDIVMLGDIPDQATAGLAVDAALAGVLVLSSLPAKNAPEAVQRLGQSGVEPQYLAQALKGVLAQRLTRGLCPYCKESYAPSDEEYEAVKAGFGPDWDARVGLPGNRLLFYRAKGCAQCVDGYKGRVALHEIMPATPGLRDLVKQGRPVEELRALAQSEGMLSLKQDGILKVVRGLIDLDELNRVVRA